MFQSIGKCDISAHRSGILRYASVNADDNCVAGVRVLGHILLHKYLRWSRCACGMSSVEQRVLI